MNIGQIFNQIIDYLTVHNQIITLLANILTAFGVLVALSQLWQDRVINKENAKRDAVKQAVEIAKIFQKQLIGKISFICKVSKEIGVDSIIHRRITDNMTLDFTIEEMSRLFSDEDLKTISDIISNIDKEISGKAKVSNPQNEGSADQEHLEKTKEISKSALFANFQYDTLNSLEWMAMLINSGAADDNVIFQSLHQLFFKIVRISYPAIAVRNSESKPYDRYYVNLRVLYNEWIVKRNKMKKISDKNEVGLSKKLEKNQVRQERKERMQ